MKLTILSFNIRCANDPDGHAIAQRAPRVAAILKKDRWDVIGMQEYHQRWEASWSILDDPGYGELWVDRGDGEGNVLRWRTDRFEALEKGHFWFADDPHTPSADWDEKYHKPRICAYAVLREKVTGTVFTYMNVHYGFGAQGHISNARLLQTFAEKLGGYPTVIAGDFNMTPDTPAWLTEPTFHGYGRGEGEILDYCFVSGDVKPYSFGIVTDTFDGKFPSDHHSICMELEI